MFGARYFGKRYFGGRYFGPELAVEANLGFRLHSLRRRAEDVLGEEPLGEKNHANVFTRIIAPTESQMVRKDWEPDEEILGEQPLAEPTVKTQFRRTFN